MPLCSSFPSYLELACQSNRSTCSAVFPLCDCSGKFFTTSLPILVLLPLLTIIPPQKHSSPFVVANGDKKKWYSFAGNNPQVSIPTRIPTVSKSCFDQDKPCRNQHLFRVEAFETMASSSSNVVGVHYRVGKKIGEGSFGVIFEGTNLLNNQHVAIKFVSLITFYWHYRRVVTRI